jgi:ATP-binding cassette subfamily B protein/ATP-binding cassette subfamily C protein
MKKNEKKSKEKTPKVPKYKIWPLIKRILKLIWKQDRALYGYWVLYTLFGGVYPVAAVIIPKLLIDKLEDRNFQRVIVYIGLFLGITVIFGFFKNYIHDICDTRITKIRVDLFTAISNKLFLLDYEYTEDPGFLDKVEAAFNCLSGNNMGIEQVMHILFTTFALVLSLVLYAIIVGTLSPVILGILVFNVLVSFFISQAVKRYEYKRKDDIAHTSRRRRYYFDLTHDFSYGKDIRMFGVQDKIIRNYDAEVNDLINIQKKIRNKEYRLGFVELFLLIVQDGVVFYYLISKSGIEIGDLLMYLGAITALSVVLSSIIQNFSTMVGELLYVNDYYKFMDTSYYKNDGTRKALTDKTYDVVFDNVSFKYPNTDRYIYKNLNLKIDKGMKLAVVGVNGAGKTTLVKLLTRLFETEEGSIYLNGINIKEFEKREYYKMFSVVFQDFKMLAFKVKENVALTDHDIDEDKVIRDIGLVGLTEKINSLPKGMEQMMLKVIDPEGVEFSGGQNQKMAIARALYKDAGMIILDEPTAALDALAEEEIYQNFNKLIGDKTAIYISHRLASTRFCDKIALIGPEGIEEMGTHDELIAKKGKYYEMFMIQGKYYQKGDDHDENKQN